MRRLKLFPKIFLYTLLLMVFITSVALGTTYYLGTAPVGNNFSVSVAATVINSAPNGSAERPPDTSLSLQEGQTTSFFNITSDTNVAIPAANVLPAAPAEQAELGVAIPAATYSLVRFGNLVGSAILQAIPVVAVVCLLLSAVCALVFSRMIAAPIRSISAATRQMSALLPEAACPVRSEDEIGVLAAHVNRLYTSLLSNIRSLEEEKLRVEASEQSKIDFLRSASHELKTPVTALSATLENMMLGVGSYQDYDRYLPRCKQMCDRLSEMICEILEASRLSSSEEGAAEVEMAAFLPSLCAPYEALAAGGGLTFALQAAGGSVRLPPKALAKALGNVLGNAVRYTPAGGTVSVVWDGACLAVENPCVPLTPEQLSHIFEAFYRPDWGRVRSDGGNGLGLYITAGILDKLRLPYSFLPNQAGDGMIFSLCFTPG